jgi:hypothetical protein
MFLNSTASISIGKADTLKSSGKDETKKEEPLFPKTGAFLFGVGGKT